MFVQQHLLVFLATCITMHENDFENFVFFPSPPQGNWILVCQFDWVHQSTSAPNKSLVDEPKKRKKKYAELNKFLYFAVDVINIIKK